MDSAVVGSGPCSLLMKLAMSPVRSHFTIPFGRSPCCTETLETVAPWDAADPPHAASANASAAAIRARDIGFRLASEAPDPTGLGKDAPPARAQLVDRGLDPLANLLADLEHEAGVFRRVA